LLNFSLIAAASCRYPVLFSTASAGRKSSIQEGSKDHASPDHFFLHIFPREHWRPTHEWISGRTALDYWRPQFTFGLSHGGIAHAILGLEALLGAILGVAYMLSFIRRAFFGRIVNVKLTQLQDLRIRVRTSGVLALLGLLFGFFPDQVLDVNKLAAESWLNPLLS
jgi:hypothetical protein